MTVAMLTAEEAAAEIEWLEGSSLNDHQRRVHAGFLACVAMPSLWEFATEHCGFKDLGECHRELCDLLDSDPQKLLVLWPRGHFKSSLVTVAFVLREALYHWPEQSDIVDAGFARRNTPRTYIVSWEVSLAEGFVEEIRRICGQPGFAEKFWWALDSTDGEVSARRWNIGAIEFNNGAIIEGYSVESVPTGKHCRRMVCDDLVTLKSVSTAEQMAKLDERFGHLLSILDPDCPVWVVGTPYRHNDKYAAIRESSKWVKSIRPALNGTTPLFPERFTLDYLRELEEEQGPYTFACQYMLNPVPDTEQIFRKEWIRMDCPDRVEGGTVTVTCDPAISEKESACYTAITAVKTKREADGEKHRYLLDRIRERIGVSQTAQAIVNMAILHGAIEIGIEAIQYQAALVSAVEDEIRRRGVWFKVTPIKYHSQSKLDRIKLLQPDMAAGRYHLKPEHEDVRQELLDFPRGKTCDVIDSLALHDGLEGYRLGGSGGAKSFINAVGGPVGAPAHKEPKSLAFIRASGGLR